MTPELGPGALPVLEQCCFLRGEDGRPAEDAEAMLRRVAEAAAQPDARYETFADVGRTASEFYDLMASGRFWPGTNALHSAGRRDGFLSACCVLPVEDSMEGIFTAAKNAALAAKYGAGTAFSFSRLRPEGSAVRSTGGAASGPAGFVRMFRMAAEAAGGDGARPGSSMGVLRADHPDILAFLRSEGAGGCFRLAVGVTREFLDAVREDAEYGLTDPRTGLKSGALRARAVAEEAVRRGAGFVLLDAVNRDNIVPMRGEMEAVSPCGSQPLLPYESCPLGSIDLSRAVRDGRVDYALLRDTVHTAVHLLDNLIDASLYPLEELSRTSRATRKIGLGVMGFADLLVQLGVPYDCPEALTLAENLMGFVNTEAHAASTALAAKRGSFPLFAESIYQHGAPMRNGTVTTVAPTGTLSVLAGCSAGIEPAAAFWDGDGTLCPALRQALEDRGLDAAALGHSIVRAGSVRDVPEVPEAVRRVFACARDIPAGTHLRMQAAFQKYTDNGVAKTIPAAPEDAAQLLAQAAQLGCKAVFFTQPAPGEACDEEPPRAEKAPALEREEPQAAPEPPSAEPEKPEPAAEPAPEVQPAPAPEPEAPQPGTKPEPQPVRVRAHPAVMPGFTERVQTACGTLSVTVSFEGRAVADVFVRGEEGMCPAQAEAAARMAVLAVRAGADAADVCAQLAAVCCPHAQRAGGKGLSCPQAASRVLARALRIAMPEAAAPRGKNG